MYDVSLKRKWDAEAVRQYNQQLEQQLELTRKELAKARRELAKARRELAKARRELAKARRELVEERLKAQEDKKAIVHNIIEESDLADEVIMIIVDVPREFVQDIRFNLKENNQS